MLPTLIRITLVIKYHGKTVGLIKRSLKLGELAFVYRVTATTITTSNNFIETINTCLQTSLSHSIELIGKFDLRSISDKCFLRDL